MTSEGYLPPGKYIYYFGKQLLLPPFNSRNCFPLSFFSILVPTSVWYFTVDLNAAQIVVGTVTMILTLYFLVRAWTVEPGILPTVDTSEERSDGRLVKQISIDGKLYELAAFRAKYCKELSVTIERFDHFCPWTGNGVGVRNYFYFFSFLVLTNVHAAFVAITSFISAGYILKFRHILVAIVLYCIAIISLVGSLLIYHMYIIGKNITTAERIKNVYRGHNPYDDGLIKNWQEFFRLATVQPRISYVYKIRTNNGEGWTSPSGNLHRAEDEGDEV